MADATDEMEARTATPVEARLASTRTTSDSDLSWLPAWRIRELVAAKKLSPVEVTDHFLARVEALDPQLHAFRKLDADGARKAAKAAEAAVMSGAELGALHGVPVAIKELIAVKDMPFWDGSVGKHVTADRDAIEVERLRKAGAIVFGTTIGGLTAFEFGASDQAPQNVFDRGRICGDSSSGSACAQSSAMVPLALAADGLGSTRLPAAYCGQVGLMATRGRVASWDGSQFVNRLLSHSGPIARDVRDAAVALQVLAGPDGRDLLCLPDDPPDYSAGIEDGANGMKLLWTDDFGFTGAYPQAETPKVIDAIRRAAMAINSATVEETRQVFINPFETGGTLMFGDPGLAIYRDQPRETVWRARDTRGRIHDDLVAALEGKDFILSPTVQHVAPTREAWAAAWAAPEEGQMPVHMGVYSAHTSVANVLGWPAITVPVGLVDGLPVGLQILGRPNSEPRMLQLAHAVLAMRS